MLNRLRLWVGLKLIAMGSWLCKDDKAEATESDDIPV